MSKKKSIKEEFESLSKEIQQKFKENNIKPEYIDKAIREARKES